MNTLNDLHLYHDILSNRKKWEEIELDYQKRKFKMEQIQYKMKKLDIQIRKKQRSISTSNNEQSIQQIYWEEMVQRKKLYKLKYLRYFYQNLLIKKNLEEYNKKVLTFYKKRWFESDISELDYGIYQGILKAHPNISDKLLLQYLNAAIYNIGNKKSSNRLKQSRIKRLALSFDFDDWNRNQYYKK